MNSTNEKRILSAVAILLFCALFMMAIPTEAEAMIYEDTLRLHILANSDSDEDQALKLIIRDKILEKYTDRLKDCGSIIEAERITESLLSDIEADAKGWVQELGYYYSVTATLTREWYDTREYDNFTLPRGYYDSLQVIIGSGSGKNWWCVMYPPLCMDIATERVPTDDATLKYTKEELVLISGKKYNLKFKILEIVADAFAKNG